MSFLSSRFSVAISRSARPVVVAQRALKSAASEGVKESAEPQRPRGGDEEGVSADKVAQTDAAFEPSSGPQDSARKVEAEAGNSMQSSPASSKASDPKGDAAD